MADWFVLRADEELQKKVAAERQFVSCDSVSAVCRGQFAQPATRLRNNAVATGRALSGINDAA
ncbi:MULTISPECIES: hypothetical protein [Rhodopseudomonas]|uniref:hypothetical protein n=1 Tax=Rhodopseudomonas TaxID=1073 RepID=UPI000ADEABE4|nr:MULTISPECIES: hypothetical protein [Rhodopseudomonas]MDF3810661.1 hypothetical protein [Rhodopseudomonas sp. BAL398]WOK18454.1 hypothetical protein RBJ75_02680 [Rhodopseudomonas sp. BAL398]